MTVEMRRETVPLQNANINSGFWLPETLPSDGHIARVATPPILPSPRWLTLMSFWYWAFLTPDTQVQNNLT